MGRVEFALPDVGEGLEEGEIVSWLIAPGDTVARDQPLVEVQTDKALVELPSPVAGQVISLSFSPGDIVKVGQVLVVLEESPAAPTAGDRRPAPSADEPPPPPGDSPARSTGQSRPAPARSTRSAGDTAPSVAPGGAADAPSPATPSTPSPGLAEAIGSAPPVGATRAATPGGRPKAAPAVRKLALERGVDLASVTGTGPGGRILASDVEAAAAPAGGPGGRATGSGHPGDHIPATAGATAGDPGDGMSETRAAGRAGAGRTPSAGVEARPAADGIGWMEPGRHPLRGIRRATAETMARSWSEIPHMTTLDEVDATGLLAARQRLADAGIDATIGTLLVAAVARGLRRYPLLNASLEFAPAAAPPVTPPPAAGTPPPAAGTAPSPAGTAPSPAGTAVPPGTAPPAAGTAVPPGTAPPAAGSPPSLGTASSPAGSRATAGTIVVHADCNVGLAVATAEGLVVPVIRHADRRGLADLAAEVRRLTAAARSRRVDLDDLRGGTFTITNYGSLGGRYATPLIRPPEVGIMGFGAIRPRPLVVDGEVRARPTLPWCLSVDHRLLDGDVATAFSTYVTGLLADPIALLAELLASGNP